jgi:TonB family protein
VEAFLPGGFQADHIVGVLIRRKPLQDAELEVSRITRLKQAISSMPQGSGDITGIARKSAVKKQNAPCGDPTSGIIRQAHAMRRLHLAGYVLLAACALTAQAPRPTVSTLTIQQAREKVRELDEEISDALASMSVLPPKDQFESTSDYKKRNQAWFDLEEQRVKPFRAAQEEIKQQLYLDSGLKLVFVSYDADAEMMTASIAGGSCLFHIPKASAKEIHDAWSGVSFAQNLIEGDVQRVGQKRSPTEIPPATEPFMALVWEDQRYFGSGGSSAPSVISKVDPALSEEARKAKFSGTVMLSVVVNTDGKPENIKVTKSAGMGLDEEAVKALQQWRFKPARNNCVPAKVQSTISVNFRPL